MEGSRGQSISPRQPDDLVCIFDAPVAELFQRVLLPYHQTESPDMQLKDLKPLDQSKARYSVTYTDRRRGGMVVQEGIVINNSLPDLYGGDFNFVKAPRYENVPMEVGPLARAFIAQDPTLLGLVKNYGVKPGAVARHAARAIETKKIVDAMYLWCDELTAAMTKPGFKIHDTAHWEPPAEGEGAGFFEPPRGALGHWIRIKNHKIANYQAVVPSTWNASPRDEQGSGY